jgi:hypothetical protein
MLTSVAAIPPRHSEDAVVRDLQAAEEFVDVLARRVPTSIQAATRSHVLLQQRFSVPRRQEQSGAQSGRNAANQSTPIDDDSPRQAFHSHCARVHFRAGLGLAAKPEQ